MQEQTERLGHGGKTFRTFAALLLQDKCLTAQAVPGRLRMPYHPHGQHAVSVVPGLIRKTCLKHVALGCAGGRFGAQSFIEKSKSDDNRGAKGCQKA